MPAPAENNDIKKILTLSINKLSDLKYQEQISGNKKINCICNKMKLRRYVVIPCLTYKRNAPRLF